MSKRSKKNSVLEDKSVGNTRNTLAGWCDVIRESAKQHRKQQAEQRKLKAQEIRNLLLASNRVISDEVLLWKDDCPVLTDRTPKSILKDERLLELIWDEMNHRRQWLGYFKGMCADSE